MKKTIISVLIAMLVVLFAVSVIQAQDEVQEVPVNDTPVAVVPETEEKQEESETVLAAVTPTEEPEETEPAEQNTEGEPLTEENEIYGADPEKDLVIDEEDETKTPDAEDPEMTETPTSEPEDPEAIETEEPTGEPGEDDPEEEPTETKQPEKTPDSEGEKNEEPADEPEETPEEPELTETPFPEEPAAEDPAEEPAEEKHGRVIVTISGAQVSLPYNGDRQTVSGWSIVSISDPDYKESYIEFSGEATVSRTNVGTDYMGLHADQFANKNEEFENVMFVVTDGHIEIVPLKVEILITGTASEFVADGGWYVADGYKMQQVFPEQPQLYTEYDMELRAGYTARVENSEPGLYFMGLSEESFENKNENFDVTFTVIDGQLDISEPILPKPTEEPAAEDPAEEPADELPEEPAAEPTEEPTEEPVEEPVEEPTEETVEEEPTEEPAEEEGEEFEGAVSSDETPAAEEAEEEPAESEPETVTAVAGTEIYDENGELLYTVSDHIEMVIIIREEGRIAVHLEDGTVGYIYLPEEESEEGSENEEKAETQTLMIPAATNIRLDADGMSEIIYTLDEDTELTVLEVGTDWVKVALADGVRRERFHRAS